MHPGPVNRGVELSGEVVDSPQAVITAQVEAGVVVRMAVLYELLAAARDADAAQPAERGGGAPPSAVGAEVGGGPAGVTAAATARRRPRAPPPSCCCATSTCSTRARASTPATTCACARGDIARAGRAGHARAGDDARGGRRGRGRLTLLPAFFDPHVHLRTPGQEHKEDLETGTRAAAAGGYGGVIAMPNTDPVIDSAPLLRSLRDAAAREARVPGRLPAGDHARPGRASS